MATSETTNLQLVKYGAGTDNFIRTDYNGNLDKIDTFAGDTNQAIANKLDTANVYNGLDKSASGYALDARQGKALNGKMAPTVLLDNVYMTGNSANEWSYSGHSFTLTKASIVSASAWFTSSACYGIGISTNNTDVTNTMANKAENASITTQSLLAYLTAGTYYVWVKTSSRCNGSVIAMPVTT